MCYTLFGTYTFINMLSTCQIKKYLFKQMFERLQHLFTKASIISLFKIYCTFYKQWIYDILCKLYNFKISSLIKKYTSKTAITSKAPNTSWLVVPLFDCQNIWLLLSQVPVVMEGAGHSLCTAEERSVGESAGFPMAGARRESFVPFINFSVCFLPAISKQVFPSCLSNMPFLPWRCDYAQKFLKSMS